MLSLKNSPIAAPTQPLTWMIDLHAVVKRYESMSGIITALKGINLQINPGEFVVVNGKSGSGKTTLVNMIAALDRADSGELWVAGTPVHQLSAEQSAAWRGRTVGVVFQSFELMPSLTLLQNVCLPMDFAGRYSHLQRKQRAQTLLEEMEIGEHAHKRPREISGGQQQRVSIARALANDPPIIVADEPTGSLDSNTSKNVIAVFEKLAEAGKTVILVTHDGDIARRAPRVITLADGLIVAERR